VSQKIGYQDGIAGFIGWLRKQPGVPPRGPNYKQSDLATWPWPDKLERTLRILKDENDATAPAPDPDDPAEPLPVPAPLNVAPRTYNTVPGGADARFCTAGLARNANGRLHDVFSEYDDDGRDLGGRTDRQVPGLPPANSMDSFGPCDPREWMGQHFPPYPPESYLR
jgi:hypothetical protein